MTAADEECRQAGGYIWGLEQPHSCQYRLLGMALLEADICEMLQKEATTSRWTTVLSVVVQGRCYLDQDTKGRDALLPLACKGKLRLCEMAGAEIGICSRRNWDGLANRSEKEAEVSLLTWLSIASSTKPPALLDPASTWSERLESAPIP